MIVRFEFHGGFKDGEQVVGDDVRRGRSPASRYLFLTDGGRVGARFCEDIPLRELLAKDEELRRAEEESRKIGREFTFEQNEYFRKKYERSVFHVYEVAERRVRSEDVLIRLVFVSEETT